MAEKRMLNNYYEYRISDELDSHVDILIDGKWVTKSYFITMNPDIPDSECCKVIINGKWYYFG